VTRTNTLIFEGGGYRFLAPELLSGPEKFRTSEASDIFSLSMTFFHIWSHQPPFAHLSNDRSAAGAIRRGERPSRPDDDLGISSENMERFWILIRRMWDEERYRPGTQEVHLELEDIFPGSPAAGDLPQLTPGARLGDREQIEQTPFYALFSVSSQFGGSDVVSKGASFNDAHSFDLHPQRPIVSVVIRGGWVIDGIEVTYRLKNDQTQTVSHGTTGADDGNNQMLTLNDDEYISEATGKSGHADNGEPWMGDCIHQLQFRITNQSTGVQRTFGPFGKAFKLTDSAATTISWSGRLHAFAGRAIDHTSQVGLRGISFVQKKSAARQNMA